MIKELFLHLRTMFYLWIKSIRRKRAVKYANKQSELNDGRTYYVIKHPLKKGRYLVRHRKGLEKLQRSGLLRKDLNFMDFRREAVYITRRKS